MMSTATRMNLPIACQMNLRYREGCCLKSPLHYSHMHPCPSIVRGHGTRDGGQNGSEWRVASFGGQCSRTAEKFRRIKVWRVGLLPDRKISARQEPCPPEFFAKLIRRSKKICQIPCSLSRTFPEGLRRVKVCVIMCSEKRPRSSGGRAHPW